MYNKAIYLQWYSSKALPILNDPNILILDKDQLINNLKPLIIYNEDNLSNIERILVNQHPSIFKSIYHYTKCNKENFIKYLPLLYLGQFETPKCIICGINDCALISNQDIRFSSKKFYQDLGFTLGKITKPKCYYVRGNIIKNYKTYKYDNKIWDCGTYVFHKAYPSFSLSFPSKTCPL
jgi:hypothetical protein